MNYLEPPTIPEGMTLPEYRASRLPRHLALWKHVAWFVYYAASNKGRARIR
jgi:hypothetical protein